VTAPSARVLCALAFVALAASLAPAARSAGASRHDWTQPASLRSGILIEPGTLNPIIGTGVVESRMQNLLFDGLIRVDEKGRPVPDLAKEVPSRANGGISADGKTLTYHLAENARWSDGEPVTADDVIFTWKALMNPDNRVGARTGYEDIADITAPDVHTVRVRFKTVYAPAIFLFLAGNQGAIVPKHILGKYPDVNTVPFNTAPIGSGPYVLRAWKHGDRLIFDANPNYFRGAPKIKTIIVRIFPDTNTLLLQLRTHEIDLTSDLAPDQLAAARRVEGIGTWVTSSNGFRHIAFNTKTPPLDDVRVRRALCYAFDPDVIYEKVYFSVGDRAPADQNPSSGWADPSLKYYPHDLKRAAALLDEAGWKVGPDGIRVRNGKRLSIGIVSVTGAKANEAIEVLLQAAWREAGVELTIKNFPGATLFAPYEAGGITQTGKFDVALFSYYRNPDPNDSVLIGPASIPPAGRNVTRYTNAEIGRLQVEGVGTFDSKTRHAIYNKIQRIIVRDVPLYTLLWVPFISAYNSDLHGVRGSPLGIDFWNITEWTI
jgi:peptide/nickel transport system substrate-binding protein